MKITAYTNKGFVREHNEDALSFSKNIPELTMFLFTRSRLKKILLYGRKLKMEQ